MTTPPESWSYETSVEYYVSSIRVNPTPTPSLPRQKRASDLIEIPAINTVPLRPPRALSTSPLPSPASPGPQFSFSPGRDSITSSNLGKSRAARASTGSASIDQNLKHQRSYGKLSNTIGARTSVSGPERSLPTRWAKGHLNLMLRGEGGVEGGELKVLRMASRKVAFAVGLPAPADGGVWGISDIQHLHPSVSGRGHALSVRLMGCRVREEFPLPSSNPGEVSRERSKQERSTSSASQTSGSASHTSASQTVMTPPKTSFKSPFNRKSRQPSEGSSRLFGILPAKQNRDRSKTVSANDTTTTSSASDTASEDQLLDPLAQLGAQQFLHRDMGAQEVMLYIAFSTYREKDEWYSIFRALAKVPVEDGRLARPYRRLKLCVLDIQESHAQHMPVPDFDGSSQQEGSITSDGRPPIKSPAGKRPKSDSLEARHSHTKPGWSHKENIRVELLLDDRLVARTGWTKAAGVGATPFWGEQFNLTEVPHFSRCTLLLLRQKKDKVSVLFGKVDLPLVSSFQKTEDQRYPVRSIHGGIIGEIRLTVTYHEIDVIPLIEYSAMSLTTTTRGSKFLYVMGGRGLMEGTTDYLCRIALCEGSLMERARDMATFEARSAGTTLFRSTTPLSKTLEVLMRMMCSDFIEASLGPTIRKVIAEKIEPRLFQPSFSTEFEPALNFRTLSILTELIQDCWANMYDNRHLFPNFIRHILAHLFRMVKEYHDDDESDDLLRYKAVSSFVFLRLIGPALMTPHLFGLADSLLDPPQQRTLTLVAKVLHTLAFFSDKDLVRHSDLALFKVFIKANGDAMIDYLVSMATPAGDYNIAADVSPEVDAMLKARRKHVPDFQAEAMPHLTAAGPIDLSAEWAICCEMWYEKRQHPGPKLSTVTNQTDDIADLVEKYDGFLDRVHELACPPPSPFVVHELSREPSAATESTSYDWSQSSRPSLNLSMESTPSSEDAHQIVRQSMPEPPRIRRSMTEPPASHSLTGRLTLPIGGPPVRGDSLKQSGLARQVSGPDSVPRGSTDLQPTQSLEPRPLGTAVARTKNGHKPNLSIDTTVCKAKRPNIEASSESPTRPELESPTTARQPSHTVTPARPRAPPGAPSPTKRFTTDGTGFGVTPAPTTALPVSPLSPRKDHKREADTQRSTRRRRPTLPSFKLLSGHKSEPPPPVPPLIWQAGLGQSNLTSPGPGPHLNHL